MRPRDLALPPELRSLWNRVEFNVTAALGNTYCIPPSERAGLPSVPTEHFKRSFVYARGSSQNDEWRRELAEYAESIVSNLGGQSEEDASALRRFGFEGRVRFELHKKRERDTALVRSKKHQALMSWGKLQCEVCHFNFGEAYGTHGDGFIECHHREPISSTTVDGHTVTLDDLALVCANCHRNASLGRLASA